MSRLFLGLYGSEFEPTGNLFGLRCGQMRTRRVVHNGGWYNRNGEKLGWGDLSNEDLRQIATGLEGGEVFIVLPETESFWKFVKPAFHGPTGSLSTPTAEEAHPGKEYVSEHAILVVTRNQIYLMGHRHLETGWKYLTREELVEMIRDVS